MRERIGHFIVTLLIAMSAAGFANGQAKDKVEVASSELSSAVRSSPAYAEILLRKVELQSDIEAFSADYTETNPKMLDTRFELGVLDHEMERLLAVKPAEVSKLTLALGKLMVRKAAISTDLNRLSRSYSKDHPEVRRTAKKVDIFESAIKEILR